MDCSRHYTQSTDRENNVSGTGPMSHRKVIRKGLIVYHLLMVARDHGLVSANCELDDVKGTCRSSEEHIGMIMLQALRGTELGIPAKKSTIREKNRTRRALLPPISAIVVNTIRSENLLVNAPGNSILFNTEPCSSGHTQKAHGFVSVAQTRHSAGIMEPCHARSVSRNGTR